MPSIFPIYASYFGFLKDHAHLKPWQQDIISMLYEEAMYFSPQRATKTINEGWACGLYDTLVLTNKGYLKLGYIVENRLKIKVNDGSQMKMLLIGLSLKTENVSR